jgi:hypothetical protein
VALTARVFAFVSMKRPGNSPAFFMVSRTPPRQGEVCPQVADPPMPFLTGHTESSMPHGRLTALVILTAILAWSGGAADAADIDIPRRPAPSDIQVQQGPANCSRWTDQCVNCSRDAEGGPVCSNIGFACQPRAIRCLSPDPPQRAPAKK